MRTLQISPELSTERIHLDASVPSSRRLKYSYVPICDTGKHSRASSLLEIISCNWRIVHHIITASHSRLQQCCQCLCVRHEKIAETCGIAWMLFFDVCWFMLELEKHNIILYTLDGFCDYYRNGVFCHHAMIIVSSREDWQLLLRRADSLTNFVMPVIRNDQRPNNAAVASDGKTWSFDAGRELLWSLIYKIPIFGGR